MKIKFLSLVLIVIMALSFSGCGAKEQQTEARDASSETAAAAEEVVTPESLLKNRRIYITDSDQYGFAMSDEELAAIRKEAEEAGNPDFVAARIADTGHDLKDPESGVVFAVPEETDNFDYFGEEIIVYVLDNTKYEDLVYGNFKGEEYTLVGEIKTSFGKIGVYQK